MTKKPTPHPTPVEASWSISLDCDCPHCGKFVDLLDHDGFWVDAVIMPLESETPDSDNLKVCCPDCGKEFTVRCSY